MPCGDGMKGFQALEGCLDKADTMVSLNYEICNFFFFSQGTWWLKNVTYMTCLQHLRLKKSKLLVSVAKQAVFLDEPDTSFKRVPIYWLGKKKILSLEEPMHLVKTGLLGNWKESNWFFVCLCVPAKEWGKVSFTINASLFPRSAPLEKTSFSEVTLMSLTNRTLEDKFNKQNPGLTSHWMIAAPG